MQYNTIQYKTILCFVVLLICLLINCRHAHLWGPDEPREAEIAKEVFTAGSWAVPQFNALPFVEKPPLYYDVAALIYGISPQPGSLRLHSAILGCLMLAALYGFALKKCGQSVALCSCAMLISMPQFYRAAHWILLDIGVGAWVTAALAAYGLWSMDGSREKPGSPWYGAGFFLFAALAMLTKGVVTVFYLGIIILPFWFYRLREQKKNHLAPRAKLLPPVWTWFFFLLPVGIWLYFFCRQGGVYFLHEHFINNVFGRLLHKNFTLPGSPVFVSDVGHNSPLLFYFIRLPNMLGGAGILLPLVIGWLWRTNNWKFFRLPLPDKLQRLWDALTKPHEPSALSRDLPVFLALWSIVPFFIFSIPANKEVTYLLPSYAGTALLLTCYLADRLNWQKQEDLPYMSCLVLPLAVFISAAVVLADLSLLLCVVFFALDCLYLLFKFILCLRRKEFKCAVLPILALLIAPVLLLNTPAFMVKSRLNEKCYCEAVPKIWEQVGNRQLYLTTQEESIRGALPFYGQKYVRLLNKQQILQGDFSRHEPHAIMLIKQQYEFYLKNPELAAIFQSYRIVSPVCPDKAHDFVILLPR